MDQLSLTLQPRTITGKKVKNLRKEGLVPASICGRGVEPQNYVVDARIFGRVYQQAGRSGLIELQTPAGPRQAFIRQVQRHPITTQWLHVDFRVVDLRTPMTADVPVVLTGQNELVERGQAFATLMLHTLHVRALPGDLPQQVEIDISNVTDFNTVFHVSDLQLPAGVEVLSAAEEPVATLTPSRMAAEEAEITEQEQLGEPELSNDRADDTPGISTE